MKYVVGHQNPDTDSFCSAIVYAQYLRDIGDEAEAVVLGEPNLETAFVLQKNNIVSPRIVSELPVGSTIVLVDHNEASQSIANRETLIIDSVIDHHKVADFSTGYPLMMKLEKVGCTCTILHEIFTAAGYTPSKDSAMLMIGAIVSDTLLFKSPTTTERDRKAVEALTIIAGCSDVAGYAMDMFAAKSNLGDMAAEDMVTMDYKIFDFSGNKMGIGVLETTNAGYALGRKNELITAIQAIKEREGLTQLLLCVVDILEENTIAIIASELEEKIVSGAFGVSTNENLADLGSRVSRKKQIVPEIDGYFAQ